MNFTDANDFLSGVNNQTQLVQSPQANAGYGASHTEWAVEHVLLRERIIWL
jgi:hypothetical protein